MDSKKNKGFCLNFLQNFHTSVAPDANFQRNTQLVNTNAAESNFEIFRSENSTVEYTFPRISNAKLYLRDKNAQLVLILNYFVEKTRDEFAKIYLALTSNCVTSLMTIFRNLQVFP